MQKFIDPDHPFYRPLWRRLLIVGGCAIWTAVEFWNGATTWGMIFLAVTAYTAATLIVFFKPTVPPVPEEQTSVPSISERPPSDESKP